MFKLPLTSFTILLFLRIHGGSLSPLSQENGIFHWYNELIGDNRTIYPEYRNEWTAASHYYKVSLSSHPWRVLTNFVSDDLIYQSFDNWDDIAFCGVEGYIFDSNQQSLSISF